MDKYMATLISVLWPLTINETSDKIEVFDKLRVEYIQQLGKWGVELDFPKAGDKYNPDKHDPIREAPSSD
jgi:hypothetical protein